jgi:hypothetical protein
MRHIRILLLICTLALSVCNSCGGSGSERGTSSGGGTSSAVIAGTAAAGWPIAGQVYVKDSTGTVFGPVNISSSGSYSVDVTNGTPPFIVEASGTIGLKSILIHSVAFSSDLGRDVNLTPLTDVELINAGAAPTLFAQCTSSSNCGIPSQSSVSAAQMSLQSELAPVFTAFGVPATDFRTTPFTTGEASGQSPIDVLLDAVGFVPNATTNSFNIEANIPMATIAAGTVLGVLPPPTLSASGVPVTGPPVTITPPLNPADVAAATNAPKNVVAVSGHEQVVISWSAVSGATSYDIYRAKTPSVGVGNGTRIAGASSPYTDSGLTNGTTYYYVVVANVAGQSYVSNVVSATPSASPPMVSVSPNSLVLSLPADVPQTFTITNIGPQDSRLNFLVADDGPLSGFLLLQGAGMSGASISAVLPGGTSVTVYVSVLPQFASGSPSLVGWTLGPSIYTPQASNYVKSSVEVRIGEPFSVNVSVTGSTEHVTQVQVCPDDDYSTKSDCNATVAVGSTGVLQVIGDDGTLYSVTLAGPPSQDSTYCTIDSGGDGTLGGDMPTVVISCI